MFPGNKLVEVAALAPRGFFLVDEGESGFCKLLKELFPGDFSRLSPPL